MLVDIRFKPFTEDQIERYRRAALHFNKLDDSNPMPLEPSHPKRLGIGMYEESNFPTRSVIEHVVDDVPPHADYTRNLSIHDYIVEQRAWKKRMDKLYSERYKRGPFRALSGNYGLCDSPEQLFEYYPHLKDDDVPRFVSFYGIWRKHQPADGGFRYHKHGTYIGKQRPRCEYLYDDKHIDVIVGFNIFRVEDLING